MKHTKKEDVILDRIYDFSLGTSGDNSFSFLGRLEIALYIVFSPRYAREYLRLEATHEILRADFFPPVPELEDSIMELIGTENMEVLEAGRNSVYEVSFRNWVVAGLVILISLATSFFGTDSVRVIPDYASSFLLPIGITIGLVVTAYGALFIGTHLKELSNRFGLH